MQKKPVNRFSLTPNQKSRFVKKSKQFAVKNGELIYKLNSDMMIPRSDEELLNTIQQIHQECGHPGERATLHR